MVRHWRLWRRPMSDQGFPRARTLNSQADRRTARCIYRLRVRRAGYRAPKSCCVHHGGNKDAFSGQERWKPFWTSGKALIGLEKELVEGRKLDYGRKNRGAWHVVFTLFRLIFFFCWKARFFAHNIKIFCPRENLTTTRSFYIILFLIRPFIIRFPRYNHDFTSYTLTRWPRKPLSEAYGLVRSKRRKKLRLLDYPRVRGFNGFRNT